VIKVFKVNKLNFKRRNIKNFNAPFIFIKL
jgi:hypothetical protein